MRHFLEHLGPSKQVWWADLGQPELTPEVNAKLIAGVEADVGELAAMAAALLAERPLRRSGGPPPRTTDADVLDEIELRLAELGIVEECAGVDRSAPPLTLGSLASVCCSLALSSRRSTPAFWRIAPATP